MKKNSNYHFTFLNIVVAIFFLTSPIESVAIFEGFSIAKLSSLLVLFVWALGNFKVRRSEIIKSFVLLGVYASLTILWSIDRSKTSHQVFMFLWPSIIVVAAMNYSIRSSEDLFLYLKAFVVGCIIAMLTIFMNRNSVLANAEYAGEERLTAFGQDQNTLSFLLCVGFTIVLGAFRRYNKSIWRYFSLVFLISCVVVILSTGSRTGLILIILVLVLFFVSSGGWKNLILMFFLILLLSPVIYNYIPETIWERLFETNDLVMSGDFSDRGYIWSHGLEAFWRENFVLGVGYSNFSTMLNQNFGWQMASHNTYLSYLVDLGFVGFVFFILVLYRMFMIVCRIYKATKDIYIFAYIVPFLVVMFVLETEYKRWLFMYGIMLESYYRCWITKRIKG